MTHSVPSIFRTVSLAEYHEYALRLLLHNYVKALNTTNARTEADAILLEDSAFAKASQSYQHIVTQYLVAKMGLWMLLMMNPMHRVIDGLLTNEFASGREAILFYAILFVEQQILKLIDIGNDMADGNTNKIPHVR